MDIDEIYVVGIFYGLLLGSNVLEFLISPALSANIFSSNFSLLWLLWGFLNNLNPTKIKKSS